MNSSDEDRNNRRTPRGKKSSAHFLSDDEELFSDDDINIGNQSTVESISNLNFENNEKMKFRESQSLFTPEHRRLLAEIAATTEEYKESDFNSKQRKTSKNVGRNPKEFVSNSKNIGRRKEE